MLTSPLNILYHNKKGIHRDYYMSFSLSPDLSAQGCNIGSRACPRSYTGQELINRTITTDSYCAARQCSPLRRKFMECYIIKPAQSLLMKHLVIGQR